ncbi:MAG TPA: endopeptidase La, partial [Candidatus Dependentiae bacterium]|nr:endopeptidase La [Candidatus Dependentiae bacterium]
PEGATPKDGPLAGITIAAALVSTLTKNPTKPALAMTGEITLQGRVLAIGGLKEKLLAAKQHNLTTVILPQENFDDIQEIKKEVNLDGLKLIFVNNMDEVLNAALIKNPFKKLKPKKSVKKKSRATRA